MADQADARNIVLSLADTFEDPDKYAFGVLRRGRPTGIMWAWMERVDPKARKTPSRDVVAIRVAGEAEKAMLIAADPEKFFTEPHYRGFPAILVRLAAIELDELRELLTDAWRIQSGRA